MSNQPAQCQFCGMKGSGVYVTSNADDAPFVECNDCGACGPVEATEAEAIAAWNKAAASADLIEQQAAEVERLLADAERYREALAELVELKDLKTRIVNYEFSSTQEIDDASIEYHRRKPIAWQSAKDAIDAARGE